LAALRYAIAARACLEGALKQKKGMEFIATDTAAFRAALKKAGS